MFPCERVELSFTENAPYRFRNVVELAITPEQLFEVFADAESWPRWVTLIAKVTWTSPEPFGAGTTRTAELRGGAIANEEFLAWEPFTHIGFRFKECSPRAFVALAEDYRVDATPGGCRLTWTMALKPARALRPAMFVAAPVLNLGLRRFLRKLRTYTDARFATTQQR